MPSYTFILLLSCNIESHSFSVFITISDWYSVSTFGAVLDMVTDRPGLVFVSLPVLDIGSQWLQMYRKVLLSLGKMPTTLYLCCSTFLTGKTRHKDAKDSTNWLFKAYYGNRMFMGYCCVACELLYLILFLIAEKQRESCGDCCATGFASFLPSCIEFIRMGAIKQTINVVQLSLERFSQTAQTVSTEVQRLNEKLKKLGTWRAI
ncbi:hypothetical protein CUMW_151130 [Citrus unshiu]|uniref:Uncharacterized protein n=1 Tax=Citrus unshiu TaxID=55188 RepID=A0A2H5PMW9_CITUN|nr:hypothetical protein CUMW_151130 [Citrus unshiu]